MAAVSFNMKSGDKRRKNPITLSGFSKPTENASDVTKISMGAFRRYVKIHGRKMYGRKMYGREMYGCKTIFPLD